MADSDKQKSATANAIKANLESGNYQVVNTDELQRDPRTIFVVHGRNLEARNSLFRFLRSIGLRPLEWSQVIQLTGKASPFIGEILDVAFTKAQAVVVLMTPDDVAQLQESLRSTHDPPYESQLTGQARPNVLFEAGMAMGRDSDRTIIVELGIVRPFSDIAGRHTVRLSNSSVTRQELAERLRTAGCPVDLSGRDWHTEGDFDLQAAVGIETPQPSNVGGLQSSEVLELSSASRVSAQNSGRTTRLHPAVFVPVALTFIILAILAIWKFLPTRNSDIKPEISSIQPLTAPTSATPLSMASTPVGSTLEIKDEPELTSENLEAYLRKKMPDRTHSESVKVFELVRELRQAGFKSISDVDRMLDSASEAFKQYEGKDRYADVGVVRISACIANNDYLDIYLKKNFGNSEGAKGERMGFARYKALLK